ncbi:MAG: S8 family serine peptidase [Alistipes sp.]|nr:S8 family serine peptidase [Alistipes sp.]
MKFINLKLMTLLAAVSLCGCTEDPATDGVGGKNTEDVSRKVLATASFGAAQGELLVKVAPEVLDRVADGVTRSGASRSGVEEFDRVLSNINTVSFERVFPCDKRHEADMRAAGLDRWYKVSFDQEVTLEEASRQLAALEEVSLVQYNGYVVKNFAGAPVPYHEVWGAATGDRQVNTRAGESARFNDPKLNKQWHYKNTGDENLVTPIKAGCDINLEPAWELCAGDPEIIVAVVDEGVAYTHEDLSDNMWINESELNGEQGVDDDDNGYKDDVYGYNFVKKQGRPTWTGKNDTGHGTHVAGTVAAVNNNDLGVCGVAGGTGNKDGVRIMSCQVFADSQEASIENMAAAIIYAANNGALILQCSWGSPSGRYSSDEDYMSKRGIECEAFLYFINTPRPGSVLNGGIAIVAAGNDGAVCTYPAAYPDMVCVTSVSTDFTPSTFTNRGLAADIAAPGGDFKYHTSGDKAGYVLSCLPKNMGEYGYYYGTSMACPHVSGVAALGLSYAKRLGKTFQPDEFRSMLLGSVNSLDPYLTGEKHFTSYAANGFDYPSPMDMDSYRGRMGGGMVDAYKMLMAVRGTPAITVLQGEPTEIDLSDYFGKVGSLVCRLEVDADAKAKLGLEVTEGDGNVVTLTCSKQGAALVQATSSVGGTPLSCEVAIICRAKAASNGGWM